jgi:hypothetical protein
MKLRVMGMQRCLQASSTLIILGLLVEIVTLVWFHPLSFLLFLFVGVVLIGLGIAVYLLSLVFAIAPRADQKLGLPHFPSREAEKEVHEERIAITVKGQGRLPDYEKTLTES